MNEIWRLFPEYMAIKIQAALSKYHVALEEIRLRIGKEVELNFTNRVVTLDNLIFTKANSIYLLNQLSEHSLYRMQHELQAGYMTTNGGHRVGFAGGVTTSSGKLKQLQYITFFNIRIRRELKGIAKGMMPYLRDGQGYYPTLLIGAPQTGKTTILRDIAQLIGSGFDHVTALKVGIVDERSEIAASYEGSPQLDVGNRTDVLDACPKAEGLMMMIRSMSPNVLIADEIGSTADVQALMEAMTAGVTVICTIHGHSIDEIKRRPSLFELFNHAMFQRFVLLNRNNHQQFNAQIIDEHEKRLYKEEVLHS